MFIRCTKLLPLLMALLVALPSQASEPASVAPHFYEVPFTDTWNTTYAPFKNEGPLLDGADRVGSYIVGIPGMIISVPIGVVGAVFSQLTHNDFDKGFDASVNTVSSGFGIVGKYVVGTPVYLLKKVFYDAPKAVFTSESDPTNNKDDKDNIDGPTDI
ncbi:hypothetical protein [Ketobacter alkanivorans]|uniref:Exosortase n=1 Tax=Ketobacter alkanivorans TaxID=1917421 RepID=A0A2K9LL38_9GAMM|nr:hypothetical protein [Ketobacter alkanivorans]AUM12973.1 hypothetical protein Kalk_11295 [Ketobacter alkanivorans]